MSYSAEQVAQLARLESRLETTDVKNACRALLNWAENRKGIFLFPISRGSFSAVHIALAPDARPYADCPFAFKGAKAHMRWWFRKPCFENGLWGSDAVLAQFPDARVLKSDEVTLKLTDGDSVVRLCRFLETRV